MPEMKLFEYALVRAVPLVEREEFVNIGVILYARDARFLNSLFAIDEKRLKALFSGIDLEDLRRHITSFQEICIGGGAGGPIAQLPPAERFRWLTAKRSTILQCSPVHPGLSEDPETTLKALLEKLVL